MAARIEKLSLTTDLYVSVSRPGESNGCRMPVTIDLFRPHTWAGDVGVNETTGLFLELQHYENICRVDVFRELHQACYSK